MESSLKKKTYFVMYSDQCDTWLMLSDVDAGKLIKAIACYHAGKDIPPLPDAAALWFSLLKAQFDRDAESYRIKSEASRENGKKGGRPKENPAGFLETQKNLKNPAGFCKTQGNPEKPITNTSTNTKTSTKTNICVCETPRADAQDTYDTHKTHTDARPEKNLLTFGEGAGAVYLTRSEFARLCEKHGKEAVYGMIRMRSADKQKAAQKNPARQKEPQSDFRQLNGDVADRYAKQQEGESSYDREEIEAYWNAF